ncbi:cytochrome C [Thiocystis minor]|uniref:cytochrome-c peroxidase n=1 Tax=Thiocystis minor TaxID=61597 RepID=UPI00191280FB|nr:cytochrome c peroxidase [Thiocystis minor]MBK5963944.1 cytochrome C [Thiocystis minor]
MILIHAFILVALMLACPPVDATDHLSALGKAIFFDPSLSEPPGQSCASCHAQATGWTSPDSATHAGGGVHEGAVRGRFGNRRPPMAAYASFSPPLHLDPEEDHFVGGNFWDGRATGWLLGNPSAEQALDPFLNPVEQNLPKAAEVVRRVCAGGAGEGLRAWFGTEVCANPVAGFNAIAQAIAAFEASPEMNAFSSKYDFFLKDPARYPLSEQERLGLALYADEDKGNCAACHPQTPGPQGEPPLFTDFTYDNLGVGRNPDNPWYGLSERNPEGAGWRDEGLGGFLKRVPRFADRAAENLGKYKVPSLRNANLRPSAGFVKSYMHNGAHKSLEEVVHFYNTRDLKPDCAGLADPAPGVNCWPAPEIGENLNTEELGDLGLSAEEEAAIVAFLRTLDDGWMPAAE